MNPPSPSKGDLQRGGLIIHCSCCQILQRNRGLFVIQIEKKSPYIQHLHWLLDFHINIHASNHIMCTELSLTDPVQHSYSDKFKSTD